MTKIIACDWNGTLTSDLYEANFFRTLFKSAQKISQSPQEMRDYINLLEQRLAVAGREINQASISNLFESINRVLSRYVPFRCIRTAVSEYADIGRSKLKNETISALLAYARRLKAKIGIISSGCYENIRSLTAHYDFDFIEANRLLLLPNGNCCFEPYIIGNKWEIIQKVMEKCDLGRDAAATFFIGDDFLLDEKCFESAGTSIYVKASHNSGKSTYALKGLGRNNLEITSETIDDILHQLSREVNHEK